MILPTAFLTAIGYLLYRTILHDEYCNQIARRLKMQHMRHSPVRGQAEYPALPLAQVKELAEMDREFAMVMLELFYGPDHLYLVDHFTDMLTNADLAILECKKGEQPKTIGDEVKFYDKGAE